MNAWRFLILAPLLAGCAAGPQLNSLDREIAVTSPPDVTGGSLPVLQSTPEADGEKKQPVVKIDLPNLGPAPELTNDVWLNTPQPFRLADLRGKVVLLDMWTFG